LFGLLANPDWWPKRNFLNSLPAEARILAPPSPLSRDLPEQFPYFKGLLRFGSDPTMRHIRRPLLIGE
jgi:hypothetical protein